MLSFFLSVLESEADRQKFTEIYEQYHGLIEKMAMRILKNQQDAEDAVQNTFVQVIRHFEKVFEIDCKNLPFWIISIAKNESLMILRKKNRITQLEDWESVSVEAESVTEYSELVRLFSKLPETYRAALEMHFLLECSGKEIARKLGISESAVNTRISRGRALLKDIIEKEGYRK
jgi:RNA polymerase sigma-70 factor (ECF subfamily)